MKRILQITYILLIFILVIPAVPLSSQQFDCKGKDFWFTFIPNFHRYRNDNNPALKFSDSLYVYVASEKPTKGTITYKDNAGREFVQNFSILDTNKIYTFALTYYFVELLGYNDSGIRWQNNQCETIAKQSFHLESDDDVSVYALNQAITTSDAFFVYPTDILGEDYYILAYNGDGTTYDSRDRTPSQFAIVATEDNTTVDIKTTVPTYLHRLNKSWNINLNKGDVYLVQSAFDSGDENPDLTGSEINSNKPIAVFAGQQRSKIPFTISSINPSRDILVEQLQPYKNWGKNAFIIPFYQPYDISPLGKDLFRILAAKDSTLVFLNGALIATLNSGQFFEGPADRTYMVSSNNPISVAQYKKTSMFRGGDLNVSDPFMLIVPPKEQFQTSYRIINAQSWDLDPSRGPFKTFTEQYITLVVPDTAISSVMIDNKLTQPSKYKPILGSGYSYLNQATIDGVHSIYANAPIGVYIYGYGQANSYGYLGGMNFIPLNFRAPRILASDTCHQLFGQIEKYSRTDYGIWDVKVISSFNTNVTWNSFPQPADTVFFQAQLINKSLDGLFTLQSLDSLNNDNKKTYDIPGFTVGLENAKMPEPGVTDTIPLISDTIRARTVHSSSFNLLNYGKFIQKIIDIRNAVPEFTLMLNFPKMISPNAKLKVNYQVYSKSDTTFIDTLFINDGCFEKPLVILKYRIIGDRTSPEISHSHNPCDTMINLVIADTLQSDFGIERLTIINSTNCIIEYLTFTGNIAILKIMQERKDEDAIISIMVVDSSGNQSYYSDTIAGHNLRIENLQPQSNLYSFGNRIIGSLTCDSIRFRNNGIPDIIFNDLRLFRNIEFSIPLSQLPFIIKGGETKSLYVCFKPNIATKKAIRDTLDFVFGCIASRIILEGLGDEIVRDGVSQCNVDMKMISKKVPSDYFIDKIYPNPLSESLNLVVGFPEKSAVSIRIYDLLGREMQSVQSESYDAGLYEISINVEHLTQGQYFVIIKSNNTVKSRRFIKTE